MKLRRTLIGFAVSTAFLIHSVTPIDTNPITDFCRRFYHQTAVIKERLYIDGGFVSLVGKPYNYTNDKLLFHDLGNDDKGIPPLVNNLTKPSNVPSVIGGQLWADQANEKLYLFGGEYADNPPDSSLLWAYDTWNDSWTQVTPGFNGQGEMKRASFGAGAVVEHMGMGYYLGGWIGPQSVVGWNGDKYAVPGLISFDMVKNVLRNDSGPAGDPRVEGVLLYVPTGDDGLLISFGGYYAKGGKDPVGAPMNEIDVYDVNQKVWHRVMTSGQYPESRRRFCGGVTSASDGSSHNAYIYGGASTNSRDKGFDDIWVLTMPAFQWVKWWVHEPPNIHNGFSCNVIRKGQMIVLGGTFPYDQSVCDAPTAWGAHNMDLGQANPESAEWYGYKKNLSTYSVPQKIINIVGGSPSGSATVASPVGGFNSSDLQTLFSRRLNVPVRQPTRTPESSKNGTAGAGEPPIAVIIGPSVGVGVPLIAVLFGIGFCYHRKRSRRQKFLREKSELHIKTGRIQAYQLPTTQSPTHSPNDTPGYLYPIHPYTLSKNPNTQTAGFPGHPFHHGTIFQPYLYQPPYQHNLAGYAQGYVLGPPGPPGPPQELPTARASVTHSSSHQNDNDISPLGDERSPITKPPKNTATYSEFYGKNPFVVDFSSKSSSSSRGEEDRGPPPPRKAKSKSSRTHLRKDESIPGGMI